MKRDEFIKHVQTAAQFESRAQAEHAIQATLETLAERIVGDEAKDLAAQLPADIGDYLRGREGEMGQPFSVQEFYERVSQREGNSPTDAALHARAVFTVLREAVTPGEFGDIQVNLSADYGELFTVS